MIEVARAYEALQAIPPDLPRDEWVRAGMAAHAAGVDFDTFDAWSAGAGSYDRAAARDVWRSFKAGDGVGAGTLFHMAAQHGWRQGHQAQRPNPRPHQQKPQEQPKPRPGMAPAEVWSRCKPATAQHPYVVAKDAAGVPLDGLRVVPADDPLTVAGESMAGALVVPVLRTDGAPSSLQFIPPPEVAARLKAKDKPGKLNLPGARMDGWFSVGELVPGEPVYICEGIGQAWACWQATGRAAVVAFGWGRVKTVAQALRQQHPAVRLALVPDVGKEQDAEKIAAALGCEFVAMPQGWEKNSDVNDLAQRDGHDVLAGLSTWPVTKLALRKPQW